MEGRFAAALRRQRSARLASIIAEVKPRDADGVDLLRGRSPAAVAACYAAGGATCISVVTGRWFGGTRELLDQVAGATPLPVLCKDFIRSAADVRDAAQRGASAVLVTLNILPTIALEAVLGACRELKLDPFVEVASAEELDRALGMGVTLIAVNNRDIQTRERSGEGIERSLRLRQGRRGDVFWVSASGIEEVEAAARLVANGFDALLVGTQLMRSDDPEAATRRLVDTVRSVRTTPRQEPLIKICGISNEREVELLAELRVHMGGLCVLPEQSYSLEPVAARRLARRFSGLTRPVLVTVERSTDPLAELIDTVEPQIVQLAGLTRPTHVASLRSRFPPNRLTIMQVMHVYKGRILEAGQFDAYAAAGCDGFVIDRVVPGRLGSTGQPIDPDVLAALCRDGLPRPYLLGGGVDAHNVGERLSSSGAVGVDVCSSVRNERGIDAARVEAFLAAARSSVVT
jgi:indole-3-glycerol phosphate synthase